MNKDENSSFSWVMTFAGKKKGYYIWSVIFAVLGAICQMLPYLVLAGVIQKLLAGDTAFSDYVTDCIIMAVLWLLRGAFHGISTSFSHCATFRVLAGIRREALLKLERMPLGDVRRRGSGELKNILVERIDSMEPTLAHLLPEFSGNLFVSLATLILLFVIDWRMALAALITMPIGLICAGMMMIGQEESYGRTVRATKNLNDTAVEYISGIEVIKVFGKAKSSYDKFVAAVRECAASYVDWMRKNNLYFTLGINIMPATLVAVLPIGGLLVMNGSLTVADFVLVTILSMGLITPLIAAARKAKCHDFIMALPNGYDTIIGESGGTLSGGERQRLSIARAIMKDAPIIILDEATANVDPENEQDLLEAIQELTREKTIIMIAHRLKTVRHADQILVVDQGRIVQQGTHDELMAQEGIYRNFIDQRNKAVSWKL